MSKRPKQHFQFLCRPIPHKYAITGSNAAEEDIFSQLSKDEMEQMGVKGMPIYIKHNAKYEIKKEEGKPKEIKNLTKSLIGHVVEKFVTDNGSMFHIAEISPEKDVSTTEGKARQLLKDSAIELIKSGYLKDVSLSHVPDRIRELNDDHDIDIITKYPLELSLTTNGDREGSSILWHGFADSPLFTEKEHKDFDFYKNKTRSILDYTDYEKKQQELEDKQQQKKMTDQGISREEYEQLMAKVNSMATEKDELKRKYEEARPLAEEYKKKRHQELEDRKKSLINNQDNVLTNALALMKSLQESKVGIEDSDKEFLSLAQQNIEENKNNTIPIMNNLMTTAGRDQNLKGVAPDKIYDSIDQAFANMSGAIVACDKIMGIVNKHIEKSLKEQAAAARTQKTADGKTTVPPATTQTTLPKTSSVKQQPTPQFMTEKQFEKMRLNNAKLYVRDEDE
jgi:hypothetical protein